MYRKPWAISFMFFCVLIQIIFSSCAVTPKIGGPITQQLRDGLYEGSYTGGPNKAVVEVKIESNRIVDIKLVEHRAMRGVKADPIIQERIIEKQSTDVDAVSGATNSSYVIMNAVQKAVVKAYAD
jgi:uncharacterized protein with FMN-binding domain